MRFEYIHYMRFIDILKEKELVESACEKTFANIINDPARYIF